VHDRMKISCMVAVPSVKHVSRYRFGSRSTDDLHRFMTEKKSRADRTVGGDGERWMAGDTRKEDGWANAAEQWNRTREERGETQSRIGRDGRDRYDAEKQQQHARVMDGEAAMCDVCA
jgi:hypothetical protein